MIQHFQYDPILQVSRQEPSASSKYDLKDEIWYTNQESHIMTIHDVKDDPIL